MQTYVKELERDEKILSEKISRQSAELDRAEKRLRSLTTVRPHYRDEYDRQEQELERLYQAYLEKFRNLEYLEHQMDLYTQQEEEKFGNLQGALSKTYLHEKSHFPHEIEKMDLSPKIHSGT